MPTTTSSNHPHVRINRATHEKLRVLAFLRRQPQGAIVDQLISAELEALGNPHEDLGPLPPRQRPREGSQE